MQVTSNRAVAVSTTSTSVTVTPANKPSEGRPQTWVGTVANLVAGLITNRGQSLIETKVTATRKVDEAAESPFDPSVAVTERLRVKEPW